MEEFQMCDIHKGSEKQTSRTFIRGIEDVFSGSMCRHNLRSDEDEEALRWAILEKLPTYDRLGKTVIKSFMETSDHEKANVMHREVDVRELDLDHKQEFIDRLFKVVEEDSEKFLKKLRHRIDNVGITLPTVEVRFEHLTVEADCFVGDSAHPTLSNAAHNTTEMLLGYLGIVLAKEKKLTILKDVSGIIKPARYFTYLSVIYAPNLSRSLHLSNTFNGFSELISATNWASGKLH